MKVPVSASPSLQNRSPLPTSTGITYKHLQILSDLCIDLRLIPSTPHATILADSVSRHVLIPLRRNILSEKTAVSSLSTIDESHEHRETLNTVLEILQIGMNNATERPFTSYHVLLNLLQEHLFRYTHIKHTFNALRSIWSDLLSILLSHLHRWIVHTVIHDPFSTFFIAVDASYPTAKVIEQNLPNALTFSLAQMVTFIGNASKCTKLLSADNETFDLLKADLDNTFIKLGQQPLSASLILESAVQSWRNRAALHLSSVLPFSQISSRIQDLRAYLLQGATSFWRVVFDDARTNAHLSKFCPNLPSDQRYAAEKALNLLLTSAVAEVHTKVDNATPSEPPFTLHVSDDGGVYPHFVLSFAEGQVLAPRASVYCDIFSVTFASRRTISELRTAFVHLLVLERLLRPRSRGIAVNTLKGRHDLRRRARTRCLVGVIELRRRMMCFVEAVEWYLQAEVLQPRFDKLFRILEAPLSAEGHLTDSSSSKDYRLRRMTLFDAVADTHNEMMDIFFKDCFIADETLNTRLHTIFAVCVSFCDFVRSLTQGSVLIPSFTHTMSALDQEFCRNFELFVQMLSVQEQKGNARISSLLLRLNFNSSTGSSMESA